VRTLVVTLLLVCRSIHGLRLAELKHGERGSPSGDRRPGIAKLSLELSLVSLKVKLGSLELSLKVKLGKKLDLEIAKLDLEVWAVLGDQLGIFAMPPSVA
tara:strand:- start:279 stop:578 length:300 start_codon:yes stop_codon:yes gene_type:complete